MALLWCDGFDHYGTDTSVMLEGPYTSVDSSFSLSSVNPRSGSRCLRRNNSSTDHRVVKDFGSLKTTVGSGFCFYISSLPSMDDAYAIASLADSSGEDQITLSLNSDGSIKAILGDISGSELASSGAGKINLSSYNHFEFACKAHALEPSESFGIISSWDLSEVTYEGVSFSVLSEISSARGIFFHPSGNRMFILGGSPLTIREYSLAMSWDLSTASYSGISSPPITDPIGSANSLFFSEDGGYLYFLDWVSTVPFDRDAVFQYALSTPWDITTIAFDTKKQIGGNDPLLGQENIPLGLHFKQDGSAFYVVGPSSDTIFQYNMSTPWNISTSTYNSQEYDVSANNTTPEGGLFINPDGEKIFLFRDDNDTIQQHSMSSFDLSTGVFDNKTLSTALREAGNLADIFFNSIGTKMYTVALGTVFEYNVGFFINSAQSDGIIEVRLNGETIISKSGLTTRISDDSGYKSMSFRLGSLSAHGVTTDVDDWYIWDDTGSWNNSFLGDRRCYFIKPNQDTNISDFEPSSGSFGYKMIDDGSPDDDSTYIIAEAYLQSGSPPSGTSEFELEDLSNGTSLISAINVVSRASKTDSTSAEIFTSINSGSNSLSAESHTLTTSYRYYSDIYEYDPSTIASLTRDGFNDLSVSITADDLDPGVVVEESPENVFLLDSFPNARFAYSVRKLLSSYSGSAMRVRRDSDNTEQDIGFDSNGNLDESALTSFVGANNGYLVTWYDQSGNGTDITESTQSLQHIVVESGTVFKENGIPAIKTNDNSNQAGMSTGVASVREKSIFSICNTTLSTNNTASTGRILTGYDGVGAVGNQMLLDWFSNSVRYFDGGSSVSRSVTQAFHQVSAIRTLTQISLQVDAGALTSTAVGSNTDPQPIKLFEEVAGGTTVATLTSVSESIFYDSDQSANRSGINLDQKTYFGTP